MTNREESKLYPVSRVFFVTDSSDDNEELFETLEDAEEYVEATKFNQPPRITVRIVKHAYREDNGEWNYDDYADTFETITTIRQYEEEYASN